MENLKIYISVDIEGVTGICSWSETELNHPDHEYFRKEMTKETVVCCNKLISLGITDITVRDAHDSARNLLLDQLPKEVKVIRGWSGGLCDMMDGLDSSYDGAIFIGYHSPARTDGNPLSHTLTTSLNHIKINGNLASEFQLNAYYAKTLGVPVIMVCGDEYLTSLVTKENNNIAVVATNTGLHGAIITRHPEIVYNDIQNKVENAIKSLQANKSKLFISTPRVYNTEIHFRTHAKAYRATFFPNATRINADKTMHTSSDYLDTLRFIMFTE